MIIFLAVMITDVILLDAFNTFGMPTSTTVSIVFELLGAAVAISIVKRYTDPNALGVSVNTSIRPKPLPLFPGILVSVVISFTVGAVVQYLARLLFSFNYKRNLKYFGAIWGGFAITAITYFILIKGAKDASFMSDASKDFITLNSVPIIVFSFLGWTVILQLVTWFTRFNILKFVVLVGTFALAMAFAGNDLVNFIGVPLAGFESFKSFIANPGAEPDAFLMASLAGKVKTPTLFLLIAGVVMVITLWTSKKARSVTKTEINLARQDVGYERFGSSILSRSLVRGTNNFSRRFKKHPAYSRYKRGLRNGLTRRITKSSKSQLGKDAPYFDQVRASVNLVVASILIAFATSLKLPLSTTYVTFMVAMGTSLSDKAWGRESAVYRITGVFSVIGGWFFTAFSAFTVAFLIAMAIKFGGFVAIGILIILAILFVFRTHIIHKRRYTADEATEAKGDEVLSGSGIVNQSSLEVAQVMTKVSEIFGNTIDSLAREDLKKLRKSYHEVEKINKKTKSLKGKLAETVGKLEENSIETGHYYVQVLDYLREIAHSITFITKPIFDHVDNNHRPLIAIQVEELYDMTRMVREMNIEINQCLKTGDYSSLNEILNKQQRILKFIDTLRKKQVKRIKTNEVGTRNSMLFLGILSESKNLVLQSVNLLKSHRDFYELVGGEEIQPEE